MASKNTVTLTFAADSKRVPAGTKEVTDATSEMRKKVDKDSTVMARQTEITATSVARSLVKQAGSYRNAAEAYEDMVDKMIREKRRLDALTKNAETLGVKFHPVYGLVFKNDAEKAGESGGTALASGFNKTATSGIRAFFTGPALPVIAAAIIGFAGPVGLAAGGALVAGFGAGLTGLGLAVAAKSPVVVAHFEALKVAVQAKMMQISKPFEQTLIDMISVAQRVFNVFATELQAAFPGVAKDVSEFVFNLGEAFRQLAPVIQPVMATFGQILDAIGPQLPGVFQNIANALISLSQAVSQNADGFGKIVIFMLNVIPVAIQLITAMINFGVMWGQVWRNVGEAVSAAVDLATRLFETVRTGISTLGSFVGDVLGRMKDAFVTRFGEVLNGVRDWPSAIKAALGDVGRILWDAGWRIVGSLIDGLKARFQDVMNTLRSLTTQMPSWKGPAEVDAKLLTANGRLIIGSLVDGFRQEEPDVRSYLGDLTKFVGAYGPSAPRVAAAPTASGGEARVIRIGSDGSDLGNALLLVWAEAVRKAGGDPGTVGI